MIEKNSSKILMPNKLQIDCILLCTDRGTDNKSAKKYEK